MNRLLKVQLTFWNGKCQPKYICSCCERLWGSKKLNQHFFTTPCIMVRAIANHKLWPIEKTIMKGTLQITSVLGVISSWTFIPTKPWGNTWFGSSNQEQNGQALSPPIMTMQGSFNLHIWYLKNNFDLNIGTMFAHVELHFIQTLFNCWKITHECKCMLQNIFHLCNPLDVLIGLLFQCQITYW
jgi:hypothetical protein